VTTPAFLTLWGLQSLRALDKGREGRIDVKPAACFQDDSLAPECARRRKHFSGRPLGIPRPAKAGSAEPPSCRRRTVQPKRPPPSLDLMRGLIKTLADTKSAAYPIRLLLLPRRNFDHWEAETLILEGLAALPGTGHCVAARRLRPPHLLGGVKAPLLRHALLPLKPRSPTPGYGLADSPPSPQTVSALDGITPSAFEFVRRRITSARVGI
jgi:hypothetical protein